MSPKQSLKSRRKNSAPKRVSHADDDEKLVDPSIIPTDPVDLAKYIMDHDVSQFFLLPVVPDQFFDIVQKAKEDAVDGQYVRFTCPSCPEKVYRSVAGLHYHLTNSCPGVDLKLTCIICNKKCDETDEMIEHIHG